MGLILIAFALLAFADLIPLIRKKSRRGILGFFFFFIPAFVIAILLYSKVEVPSLLQAVDNTFKAFGISY